MAEHEIELRYGSERHRGLIRGSVTLGIEQLAHPFDFEYAEQLAEGSGGAFQLFAGDAVELLVDGEKLVDGCLDTATITRKLDEHTFQASGRAAPADLVDCAIIAQSRQLGAGNAAQLVEKIVAPFGFHVSMQGESGDTFRKFTYDRGETAFEAISRICRMRGFWPRYVPGTRTIDLVRLDDTPSTTILSLGRNVLEMTRETDWRERFSEYHFVGSTHATDDVYGEATRFRSVVRDPAIARYRPTRLQMRGADGSGDAGQRALLDRNHRAGRSENVTCVVSGWRDDRGELWAPNTLHVVRAPELGLNDVRLLITSATYRWDVAMERGFTCELQLKRRETFDENASYPVAERGEWR